MAITINRPVEIRKPIDEIDHLTCECNDDIALCGTDVSNLPWTKFEKPNCVVCLDMMDDPCPLCGE